MKAPPAWLRGLVALWLVFAVIRLQDYARGTVGVDFFQFWAVGRALSQDHALDPYAPQARAELAQAYAGDPRQPRQMAASAQRPVLETYSTPLLYGLFALTGTGNYEFDFTLYQLISLGALLGALLLLGQLAALSWPLRLLVLTYVLEWAEPVWADVRTGNVARLQLLGLALAALALTRRTPVSDALGGLVLGGLLLFKPNLVHVVAALGLWALRAGQGRRLRPAAAGGLGGVLLGAGMGAWSLGGPGAWARWLGAVRAMPADIITLDKGNCAWVLLPGLSRWPLLPALAGLALLALLVARVRPGPPAPGVEARVLAYGALAALLGSPLAWMHYYVLALPALVLLLGEQGDRLRGDLAVVAALGLASRPLGTALGTASMGMVAVMFNAAALVLVVGLARALRRDVAEGGPSPA